MFLRRRETSCLYRMLQNGYRTLCDRVRWHSILGSKTRVFKRLCKTDPLPISSRYCLHANRTVAVQGTGGEEFETKEFCEVREEFPEEVRPTASVKNFSAEPSYYKKFLVTELAAQHYNRLLLTLSVNGAPKFVDIRGKSIALVRRFSLDSEKLSNNWNILMFQIRTLFLSIN